jgi:hypothetical protein
MLDLPDPDRLPYDRQPHEPDKAWNAFLKYRNLGPERALKKVVEELAKPTRYLAQIQKWSGIWAWHARAVEWDREIDTRSRKARLAAAARASNEMTAVAESLWKLAARDLVRWHRKIEVAQTEILSPTELQKLVDTGMRLHRLAIGEPLEDGDRIVARIGVGSDGGQAIVIYHPEKDPE